MAITVGTLRTFCEERASPDLAGGTADREFMNWINSALVRLYKAAPWDRLVREEKRTIVPHEAYTGILGMTQGSLALVTSSGTFLAKYLSERYELVVDGYDRGAFEIAAIGTPATSATLRTGDEWPRASSTTLTGYFLNTRFSIPLAKNVTRVMVVETGLPVTIMTPLQFDRQRDLWGTGHASDPRFCTWRRGCLEIWPHPGENYRKLSITYQLAFTRIPDSAADADTVEWDEEQQDLLEKAIILEAAITRGENAVIPYVVALREYEQALHTDKEYSQREDLSGPMGLRMPIVEMPRRSRGISYNAGAHDSP